MAKADLIVETLISVEDAAAHLDVLLSVLLDVGGDQGPAWVALLLRTFDPLQQRLELLGTQLRQVALPHLRDLDRVNGGMGGVPPMVTKAVAGQSAPSRP